MLFITCETFFFRKLLKYITYQFTLSIVHNKSSFK